MKKIYFQIIVVIILILLLVGTLSAVKRRYLIGVIGFNSSATTTFTAGDTNLVNCVFNQSSSSYATVNANHYIQWNSTSTAWVNASTSADVVWVSSGTNPIVTALPSVDQYTNSSTTSVTVTFRDAGNYYLRCWEPAESADESAAKTSNFKYFTVNAAPANCWGYNSGTKTLYIPAGCTYYIPGGTLGYVA